MKIIKFLTGRLFVTILLIAVQLLWFILFWLKLSQYSSYISVLFTVLSILIVLYIVSKDDNPSFKIPWIIIIMLLPILGGLLYIFFGTKQPLKRMSFKLSEQHKKYKIYKSPNKNIADKINSENERMRGSISYLQNQCSFPVWENTQTNYYPVGEEMYADMLLELEKAKHFIFMEYFIIEEEGTMWNGIHDILKKKASEGVDVRLIYDDVGCLGLLPKDFNMKLEQEGIKCIAFNPFVPFLSLAMNNRDHRKILVIDGHTGINIADEYINKKVKLGHWKDTGIRIVGDAVWNFTVMFLEMWNAFRKTDEDIQKFAVKNHMEKPVKSDGFVIPFGDSPIDEEATGQNVYIDILNQATKYVYIFTPYLIMDDEMQGALRLAAKRGVDVRLVTPGIPDKQMVYRMARSYYPTLLRAGVKIYEYSPGFLHAKSYVCDDEIAVVGTINMDFRSLFLHFECGTYLYKTKSVMQMKEDFLNTIEKSREILPQDKSTFKLLDSIIRVFAPLM